MHRAISALLVLVAVSTSKAPAFEDVLKNCQKPVGAAKVGQIKLGGGKIIFRGRLGKQSNPNQFKIEANSDCSPETATDSDWSCQICKRSDGEAMEALPNAKGNVSYNFRQSKPYRLVHQALIESVGNAHYVRLGFLGKSKAPSFYLNCWLTNSANLTFPREALEQMPAASLCHALDQIGVDVRLRMQPDDVRLPKERSGRTGDPKRARTVDGRNVWTD